MRVQIGILIVLVVFAICIICEKAGGSGSSGLKITDVLPEELEELIEENEYVLVYFYDNDGGQQKLSKEVMSFKEWGTKSRITQQEVTKYNVSCRFDFYFIMFC